MRVANASGAICRSVRREKKTCACKLETRGENRKPEERSVAGRARYPTSWESESFVRFFAIVVVIVIVVVGEPSSSSHDRRPPSSRGHEEWLGGVCSSNTRFEEEERGEGGATTPRTSGDECAENRDEISARTATRESQGLCARIQI